MVVAGGAGWLLARGLAAGEAADREEAAYAAAHAAGDREGVVLHGDAWDAEVERARGTLYASGAVGAAALALAGASAWAFLPAGGGEPMAEPAPAAVVAGGTLGLAITGDW